MLLGFKAQNHTQQVGDRGARDEVDDRATQPIYFAEWDERFGGFTLDVAAAPHNTKCARYFTKEQDGLRHSWAGERVWCNPPYSNLEPWLAKAWDEYPTTRGIAMLLPANRCEQKFWQKHVEPFRDRPGSPLTTEFGSGRMRFIRRDRESVGANERPPFGIVLLVWAMQEPSNMRSDSDG